MSTSKFHQIARDYAASGIPIFPCLPGTKIPATDNGFHGATTDPSVIDAWWTAEPQYNPAFCPHEAGWGVVDIDGPEGRRAWEELAREENIGDTFEVETPRGGSHLYFEGELPMTAWRPGVKRCLGEHIDTRGVGSYVLAPGAVINDYTGEEAKYNGREYKIVADRPLIPVPSSFAHRLRKRDIEARTAIEQLDLPGNVERGRTHINALLERGDIARAGQGGNNRTYQLACELLNLGLSPDTARALLEPWNNECVPPWSDGELEAIIGNAASYAQNEMGAWGVAPAEEVFGSVLDNLPSDLPPEQQERRSRFYFEDEAEQDTAKETGWLIENLIPDASSVLIVGPKGNFKSFIAHDIMLSLAADVETFGVQPRRSGPTFYGTHEGAAELKRPRRRAWKLGRGIETSIPIFVAPAPRIAVPEECEEFREQIRARLRQSTKRIAAIALDTVAKCMSGLDENSAADMGLFVAFVDSLVYEFQCPVIALHHTKKDGSMGSRGSGALEAGFSTVIDVHREGKSKLVKVSVRYHKDAEEPEKPWTFQGRTVGPSLVFDPISGAEFAAQTMDDDLFDRRKVGAALRELRAIGQENGVTTDVLASHLTPAHENESLEDHAESLKKSARILNKLSHSVLEAYCSKVGRQTMWWLPEGTPEDNTEAI